MLEVISQSSYVIQTITKLLRLMLVASGQAPSTFPCSSCFLYLRTFAPVPTPLINRLSLFFEKIYSNKVLWKVRKFLKEEEMGYQALYRVWRPRSEEHTSVL